MYDLFMTRTLVYVKLKNEDAGLVLLVFKILFIIQKKKDFSLNFRFN